MQFVLMPKSASTDDKSRRPVWLSESALNALEQRKQDTDVNITAQLRRAVERYIDTPHDIRHRLHVTDKEASFPAVLPNDLWGALKNRKKESGLGINDQIQVAVALYLQDENQQPATSTPAQQQQADLELTPTPETPRREAKPLSTQEEERLRRMMKEVFEEEKSNLFEDLKKHGFEPKKPVVPALQLIKKVPRTMIVSAGIGLDIDELDNIVESIGDAKEVEIGGKLAEKVTPHSYVAVVRGWSMSQDGDRMSIQNGAEILLTPRDEYPRDIKSGTIVLAEIEFKDGRIIQTLKSFERRRLKANNPQYPGFDLGPHMQGAVIKAVCRGVLEKVFD